MNNKPPIDEKLLGSYAILGLTDADLATILGISIGMLRRRNRQELTRARAERRYRILCLIWQKVKDGDTSLLTWLGKTELGWGESKNEAPPVRKRRVAFDFVRFSEEFALFHETEPTT